MDNVFEFWWNLKKVRLMLLTNKRKNSKAKEKNFLTIVKGYLNEYCSGCKKLLKEDEFELKTIFKEVQPLLAEFTYITLLEIPKRLPLLHDIQHHINLAPSVNLPNLPIIS